MKPVIDVQRQTPQWKGVPAVAALIRRAVKQAVRQADVPLMPGVEIAVSLADDEAVRAANKTWRKKNQPTNVLSFPAVPVERLAQTPFLGDIILAYETVAEEARAEHKSINDHISHLVVHGVLHLLGQDHMTDEEAERMEALEISILASLGIKDPYGESDPMETRRP